MQVARYPNEIYPYLVSYRSIRVAMFSSKRIDGVRIRFFFYQQFMPPWKTGTYCSSIGHQLLIYLLEKLYCACAVKFLVLGVRPLVNGREAAIEDRNFRSRLYTRSSLQLTNFSIYYHTRLNFCLQIIRTKRNAITFIHIQCF